MGRVARFALGLVALALLVGIALWAELRLPRALEPEATEFELANVTAVIPGVARWEHATLHVRDGRIERIVLPAPNEEPRADGPYAGRYVLPGLIDLHSHLPPDNPLRLTPYYSLLYLAFGVTTIRDVGDIDGTAVPAARAGIESGRFPGPRLFACGPFVSGGPATWPNSVVLEGPEDAEPAVAELAARGSDCVKAYEGLTRDELAALVAAGEQHGLPVLGHVPAELAYEEAGLPDVHHLLGVAPPESLGGSDLLTRVSDWDAVDARRRDEVVEATVAQRIANTPTLVATHRVMLYEDYEAARQDPIVRLLPRLYRDAIWHPDYGIARNVGPDVLEQLRDANAKKLDLVGRLHGAGAELRLGSDASTPFVVPGASLHEEMRLFVEAGMTPEQVWAIGTWKAGRALGDPLLGTLQAEAPADLLVFREDPTRDLAALASLEAVVAAGRLYPKAEIDAQVELYRQHYAKPILDWVSVWMTRWTLSRIVAEESE